MVMVTRLRKWIQREPTIDVGTMGALAVLFYGREIDHLILVTYPAFMRGE